MRALIMAGGAGSRLDLGEKPLIPICGYPMIAYIIQAFQHAGYEPVVTVSSRTPMTLNWCRANNIGFCKTEGRGYVEDMVHAIHLLDEEKPLFISVSDIPCITADLVKFISEAYDKNRKDALSTWVPASLVTSCQRGTSYREQIDNIEACPVGINILRGDCIDEVQNEYRLLLNEPRLAFNVNSRADRAEAEAFMHRVLSG